MLFRKVNNQEKKSKLERNVFRTPRQVINITFSQGSVILFMSYCILKRYPLQPMENNTIYTYPGSSYNQSVCLLCGIYKYVYFPTDYMLSHS